MKLVTVKYIVLRNGVTADFVRYDLLDSLLTVTYFCVHEHVLQWRQGLWNLPEPQQQRALDQRPQWNAGSSLSIKGRDSPTRSYTSKLQKIIHFSLWSTYTWLMVSMLNYPVKRKYRKLRISESRSIHIGRHKGKASIWTYQPLHRENIVHIPQNAKIRTILLYYYEKYCILW
jgi:hypothetical protein